MITPDMIQFNRYSVVIVITVYSEVPGRMGTWELRKTVEFPSVPRVGDYVQVADDVEEEVRQVTWFPNNAPFIHFRTKTDSPAILDQIDDMATRNGFERLG